MLLYFHTLCINSVQLWELCLFVTPHIKLAENHTSCETLKEIHLGLLAAPGTHHACSHIRASALPVLTIWNALPPDSFMTQFSPYLDFLSRVISMKFC